MNTAVANFRRAKETSFLIIDELVFDKLSPYALKVYGQLRKIVSYTKQCDDVKIPIKKLATLSGISERKTYDVLNELEHTHHIIQRTNEQNCKYGQVNCFSVSQTYGFFRTEETPTDSASNAGAVDNIGQDLNTPAQYAEPPAQYAYLNKQESYQEYKKQNNKKTVSVFSDKKSVKDHITTTAEKRKSSIPDSTIEEILFYIGEDRDYQSVAKKTNIALKLVREVRWKTPNGFGERAIREREAQWEKQKKAEINQSKSKQEATEPTKQSSLNLKNVRDFVSSFTEMVTGRPYEPKYI